MIRKRAREVGGLDMRGLLELLGAQRPTAGGALVAVALTGLATGLGLLVGLGGRPGAAALYVVAVLVAVIVGGIWTGLLASALSFVGLLYFFLEPFHTFEVAVVDAVALAAFVAAALLASTALPRLQASKEAAEVAEARLEAVARTEREAREAAVRAALRTAGLQALAIRLAEARSTEAVLAVLRDEGAEAAGASRGAVEAVPAGHPLAEHDEPVWADSARDVAALPAPFDRLAAEGHEAAALLPLPAEADAGAVLLFAFGASGVLTDDRRRLVQTVASQCSLALERARLFEQQRSIAETLQRSFLPDRLPLLAGLRLAATYLPATEGMHVGGDWYDAIELDDGKLVLVIGDVVGHGLGAASTMGQIRNAARAYAHEGLSPAAVLARLNAVVGHTEQGEMTTVVVALVDPVTHAIVLANAGHPPPLAIEPGGTRRYEERGRSVPLGVVPDAEYHEAVVRLEDGGRLVLYTDGLVERRGESLDAGLARLACAAAALAGDDPASALVEETGAGEIRHDDIAVVVLELLPVEERLRLAIPADPAAVVRARRALQRFVAAATVDEEERYDIVLACGEAVANAVEHAYGPAGGTVEVEAVREGGDVVVEVRDAGRWREQHDPRRGLGLVLANAVMDDVEVESGVDGTLVRLRRRVVRAPSS